MTTDTGVLVAEQKAGRAILWSRLQPNESSICEKAGGTVTTFSGILKVAAGNDVTAVVSCQDVSLWARISSNIALTCNKTKNRSRESRRRRKKI